MPTPRLVMLIRHGEKPLKGGGPPHGIDETGEVDDKHSLTAQGWTRAGGLIDFFRRPVAPIERPDHLFAASPGNEDTPHGRRPSQTVAPLADALGKKVHTEVPVGDEPTVAEQILAKDGAVLVCWEHKALTAIVQQLGLPDFKETYDEDRFDLVWLLHHDGDGYRFSTGRQALLAADDGVPRK
jgi:hypothetical protein